MGPDRSKAAAKPAQDCPRSMCPQACTQKHVPNTSYPDTWAWRRQAILEYKLSQYLGLAAPQQAWRHVRTASRTAHGGSRWAKTVLRQPQDRLKTAPEDAHKHAPRIMYRIQAISIPGLRDAKQSWNTSYLSTWACTATNSPGIQAI